MQKGFSNTVFEVSAYFARFHYFNKSFEFNIIPTYLNMQKYERTDLAKKKSVKLKHVKGTFLHFYPVCSHIIFFNCRTGDMGFR